MTLTERWFSLDELRRTRCCFTELQLVTAQRQVCLPVYDQESFWILFNREPTLRDLNWLGCTLSSAFHVGQIEKDAEDLFLSLLQKQALTSNHVAPTDQHQQGGESELIRLLNGILLEGYQRAASDIHFENTADGLVVKYRIDGVLLEHITVAQQHVTEQLISRLKVLAELDIAERRIPQDGRLTVQLDLREIDLRISIMPGLHGEDAVLRVLDKQAITRSDQPLQLEQLGFDQPTLLSIRQLACQPYGMLLVTGPTGSGKTTTLYALLHEHNTGQQKIITIEDPVEYQIKGTLQIPVNEKKGLTFAKGLRSILRHDPDTIMVGEIRDQPTADIAVQAALTGHLVYTSVHANHALDIIGRFRHMEIDLYGFVSSLNGIVAQRLIRLNCQHCVIDILPSAEMARQSMLSLDALRQFNLKAGTGCEHCRGTGYQGRQAIAEVLVLNDELREMIIQGVSTGKLRQYLTLQKMPFLRQQALAVVAAGKTTLQEINRVTFAEA